MLAELRALEERPASIEDRVDCHGRHGGGALLLAIWLWRARTLATREIERLIDASEYRKTAALDSVAQGPR